MKKTLLALSASLLVLSASSQTNATNFTCNDCASTGHDLFTELNAGMVIVITWVVPNSATVPHAQSAFGAVQMYSVSNPGQVHHYLVDDYGDTPCATLNNWAMANSLGGSTTFSDAAIDMADYGMVGAPKTVVLGGGWNHVVYFNENGPAANNGPAIENAIDSALSMITAMQAPVASSSFNLFPNPANASATVAISAEQASDATVKIFNVAGQEVMTAYTGTLSPGENRVTFSTEALAEGVYIVRMENGEKSSVARLIISR
jgi:hypothetical protein